MLYNDHMLSKGTFVISIDYEFALGFADFDLNQTERDLVKGEVVITRRLVSLFEQYNIPVTWAIVGHLLESVCPWRGELAHSEYPRPIYKAEKQDWFLHHPVKDIYDDVLWFDREKLIPEIARSTVGHEIASHSYSHIIYGLPAIDKRAVQIDLASVKRIHIGVGLPVTSFVFPRNKEAYHSLLEEQGFTSYRGVSSKWYKKFPGFLSRGLRLVDYYLPTVRTAYPFVGKGGLVNIPESMMLLSRNGPRKMVTAHRMERKIINGLHNAVEKKKIFHLWFHPSNFWYETETQFKILQNVLKEASHLRDLGDLDIMTMRGVTEDFLKDADTL
jgi:peptidoglycan/xylan/chitin deacetylase (PgdA/CDA1 family)